MSQPPEAAGGNPWPAMFDAIAEQYDQSGVPWFRPIARSLLALLEPRPGERFLELGAGRGALTFPLAEAVGPEGGVDALDISPSMVRLLRSDLERAGLRSVRVATGDASDPRPPGAPYDAIAASLVIFFLPDPAAALSSWRPLLRPGGRVGVSTFPVPTGRFAELVGLMTEYAGPGASPRGGSPFDSDEGVESLMRDAGFHAIATTTLTTVVPFADAGQWRSWTMGTALRRMWTDSDESRHADLTARAQRILAQQLDERGRMTIDVPIRYTVAAA